MRVNELLNICMQKQPTEVFCTKRCTVRKGVLRNFTKLTGKDLCQSLYLNKVADLRPGTLLKKILWHKYYCVNFAKFPSTPF